VRKSLGAAQHGCEWVVMESDSLQLVNMMQASAVDVDRSFLCGLRQELQELAQQFLYFYCIFFCS
jgi:hypothetical protein